MSKKSRKRNKKILAAIGIGLGAAAMASKRKSDLAGTENGKGGIDTVQKAKQSMTKDNAYSPPKKKSEPKKVYQDDIMRGGSGVKDNSPKNPYSIRTDKTPIKFGLGAQKGYTKTSIPKATTTIQDNMPAEPKGNTATGSLSFNDKIRANNERIKSGLKSGGRAGYKHGGSTGSSKSYGAAKRGISPILMKGRK
jgi:hypothetical protein